MSSGSVALSGHELLFPGFEQEALKHPESWCRGGAAGQGCPDAAQVAGDCAP